MKQLPNMKSKELNALAGQFRSIYFCKETYDCALLATGCVLQVVDEVLERKVNNIIKTDNLYGNSVPESEVFL